MFIKNTPDYAKDFKNEYLFIIGINNEFKYFLDNMKEATRGLFENFRVDKIKKFISKFLSYQNSGHFKDLSNFEIKSSDINPIQTGGGRFSNPPSGKIVITPTPREL